MVRKIIEIDEEKCNGCGLCVNACHEGAIGLIDGKAKLLRDDYCDGLGNCLPVCPTDAISFVEREALEFDEAAVKENMDRAASKTVPSGCPGTNLHQFNRSKENRADREDGTRGLIESRLNQWPVQIKLVPVNAPYFHQANLLIAADCAAYAYGNFHEKFMKNKITLIGCPKLDEGEYSEKLTAIIEQNQIKSLTVVRMEVPCCGGIEQAAVTALKNSNKMIPWQVVTISTDGTILED